MDCNDYVFLIALLAGKLFGIVFMRILVPPEDVATLADAMSDLISYPEKREKLATRAVEVIDRYGVNRIIRISGQGGHEINRGDNELLKFPLNRYRFTAPTLTFGWRGGESS